MTPFSKIDYLRNDYKPDQARFSHFSIDRLFLLNDAFARSAGDIAFFGGEVQHGERAVAELAERMLAE